MNAGIPHPITRRFLAVWQRNWTVYRRTWTISFLPPLLEPLLYIAAFGVGLRGFIGDVSYAGRSLSYVAFLAPGLIAAGIMNSAFFETTYASFVRMYYQKTFDAIMSAPVSVEEVIAGEIVWGATRAVLAAGLMGLVLGVFGLVAWPSGLWLLPLAFLGGLAFGAVGMTFTGLVATIELFNLPTFLFITPMFLFCGAFFPLDALPTWAQNVALVFPLTHLTRLTRALCLGTGNGGETAASVAYLLVFTLVFFRLALRLMRRRLIH